MVQRAVTAYDVSDGDRKVAAGFLMVVCSRATVARRVARLALAGVFATCAWGAAVGRADTVGGDSVGAPAGLVDHVRLPDSAGGMGWHQVGGAITKDETIIEMVPDGQTDLDWNEIITVKSLALTRSPQSVVDGSLGVMRQLCGHLSVVKTPQTQQLGDAGAPGASVPVLEVADMVVTCSDPDIVAIRKKFGTDRVSLRRYEVTWYRMMMGQRGNYVVQRAWHGDDVAGSVLASRDVLADWKQWLTHVTVVRSRGAGVSFGLKAGH